MKYIWDIDPVAISILGLDVRWYGLAYVLGFFFALWFGQRHLKTFGLEISKPEFENMVFGVFFSGVLGGRIGEFLFYSPSTFWTNPVEILKVWHGGMSIHGGLLLAVIFLVVFCRKRKIPIFKILDLLVIPLAIALVFGRLANFINGELVGVPTDQTWGVVFPHVDEFLRHPSQLYEVVKNFVLAGILIFCFKKNKHLQEGFLFTVFLFFYGVFRFFIEFVREADGVIWFFSTGQVLCIIMAGAAILIARQKKL
ncbi:MAG: prolipoprotein diacylglyceryl transferase [Candidatus Peregrinibacteria bacterium]|nr:prolipoprotein diacylglyceryl transferase [Candidatus Peregrinibacteria bacterium]